MRYTLAHPSTPAPTLARALSLLTHLASHQRPLRCAAPFPFAVTNIQQCSIADATGTNVVEVVCADLNTDKNHCGELPLPVTLWPPSCRPQQLATAGAATSSPSPRPRRPSPLPLPAPFCSPAPRRHLRRGLP